VLQGLTFVRVSKGKSHVVLKKVFPNVIRNQGKRVLNKKLKFRTKFGQIGSFVSTSVTDQLLTYGYSNANNERELIEGKWVNNKHFLLCTHFSLDLKHTTSAR
jgi:hypothetical protein